ncbi:DoxX family protein [Edwardsiella piscicida]|uniref:DoxX family protein n=1 Tax=Edwardsiella piscicida TaxID=1263550 RepID=UPI0010A692D4|nr:DoxX family protein [Edwardsiella piscicida]
MQQILTWGLLIIFLASGAAKLAGLAFEQAAFARWGYPQWFMYAVGAAETLGALGLLSRLRRWAAGGLLLLMLGALQTHLRFGEWGMLLLALILAAGLLVRIRR